MAAPTRMASTTVISTTHSSLERGWYMQCRYCIAPTLSSNVSVIVSAVGTVYVALFAVRRSLGDRRARLRELLDLGDLRVIDEELEDLLLAERVHHVVEAAIALPLGT